MHTAHYCKTSLNNISFKSGSILQPSNYSIFYFNENQQEDVLAGDHAKIDL